MLRKSKAIKKFKLDLQNKMVEEAHKQKKHQVVQHKVENAVASLKTVNAQYHKYFHLTKKIVKIDQVQIESVIQSLKKQYKLQHTNDNKIYLVVTLKNCPEVNEAKTIQVVLPHPIYKSRIGFVSKDEEFKKKYLSQFTMLSQKQYFSKDSESRRLVGGLNLIFIDYQLHKKAVEKKFTRKIFPFHPGKVPFEVKKHYNISDYQEYLNHLRGSSFTLIQNEIKQMLPIGIIDMETQMIQANVNHSVYDFIAKILNLTRHNEDFAEYQVGITAYLNEGHTFDTLFKHRFTDFIVNELDLQQQVTVIQNKSEWRDFDHQPIVQEEKKNRINHFENYHLSADFEVIGKDILGEEATLKILEYVTKLRETGRQTQFEVQIPLPEAKEERLQIHQLIREKVPFMESFTKNQQNQKQPSKQAQKQFKLEEKLIEAPVNHILIRTSQINFKKLVSTLSGNYMGESKKFVKFILMKRNMDSINAGIVISKQLGLSNKHFSFAGTKDKRGITSQWASLQGITMEQLIELQKRKSWHSNLLLSQYEYCDEGIKLGDLYGNRFTVVLRFAEKLSVSKNWEVLKNMEILKSQGFLNYFGLQRFGQNQIKTHHIGKLIIQQDWKNVVHSILLSSRENEKELIEQLLKFENWNEILLQTPYKLRIERQLVESLIKMGSTNYLTALQQLPRNVRELYTHAYQSYLWNKIVSKRIQEYGNTLRVGDLVIPQLADQIIIEEEIQVDLDVQIENQQQTIDKTILITPENITNYELNQIVMPMFGTKINIPKESLAYELVHQLLLEENITPEQFELAGNHFFVDGAYRYMIARANNLNYQMLKFTDKDEDILDSFGDVISKEGDLDAIVIRFDLLKSSYATMLIRELSKCASSLESQQRINEKYRSL